MDIQKFVELLEQYPSWFKSLVIFWIIIAAFLVVGFLTLRQPQSVPNVSSPSPPPHPSGPEQQDASTSQPMGVSSRTNTSLQQSALAFDDYAKQLRAISDRFMERQDFVTKLSGTVVTWDGVVYNVSENHIRYISLLQHRQ